jgi:ornithine carbamoyltransferase
MGMSIVLGCPKGYEPDPKVVAQAKEEAKRAGCEVKVTHDPKEAVKGADIVYTDVWASMGKEKEREERIKILKPYQVNLHLVKGAKEDYIFIRLPFHRGGSDGWVAIRNSVIFDQAEPDAHSKSRHGITM